MKAGYFPGSHPKNNVHTFLDLHLAKNPKAVILMWMDAATKTHKSITVEELHRCVGKIAAGYKKLGIKKGDRVILFVPMSVQLYSAMFALQKIGAIPVFLDSWARRAHLGASANIVQPVAMVSFEKAFDLCEQVPELAAIPTKISVGTTAGARTYAASWEGLIQTDDFADVVSVEQEDTALVTFTTGSSGVPKGANRTHRFLAAQHYALNECIPYVDGDVDLPVFPIFSLNNLAAGVPTVIPAFDIGVPGDHDADILLAQILSTQTTCTTLSPSLFSRLAAHCLANQITLGGLKRVVTGGAPVSRDNVADFQKVAPNAEIWVLFGSTEAEPMAHIEGKEMLAMESRALSDPEWVDEGVNVGKMAEGLNYRFLKIIKDPILVKSSDDWKEIEVPYGEVGELIVAGEHVCRNYYNDEQAFFRAKILDENGVVWHRTGDLGRMDSIGHLWIVGRVHNAIERGGRYEFPVRAEMILKKLPFVKLAAYVGLPDPNLGEKAVCAIVTDDGDQTHYRSEVERIMKKNGVPVDQVTFLPSIPMDPRHHSKVEYEVLKKDLQVQQVL